MRNLFAKLAFKFALLIVILTSVSLLHAQDSSSMTGVVSDSTGALVPGAIVTLTNPSTGTSYTKTTDNLGSYRFASVPAGTGYKVTFTHDGFSTAQVSDIPLAVGITRTQNIVLSVGGESQTVSVSAGNENVTLNTSDATIGNNIDVNQLNDLPVYDRMRGVSTLMYQQAGVDSSQGAVTGARIDQSEVTVDGLDVDDVSTGQTFYLTSPAPVDSVQQFTGAVAGLDSNTGTGSGGQFQLVTKNGTNQFHGNLNEYHRDTTTVANTWFNNLNGIPRTPLIRNQFGGDLGGPIKRDKLFFFFNWADSRIVQSSTGEPTVPLDVFRSGQLNYINSNPGCGDNSRLNNAPNCITTLTSTQVQALDPGGMGFDAGELAYINARYPHVNDTSRGDGVNTGGYRFTYPTPDNNANYIGRIDYNLTPTQTIFGRFTIQRRDAVESIPEFPSDPSTHPFYDRSYSYVVSHEWTIGKNKTNTIYYGDTISKLDFPDTYNPTGVNQYSFSGLSGPYTTFDGQQRRIPVPLVRDDFNWQKGNHSFTFGGTFKFIKTNSHQTTNFNYVDLGLQGAYLSGGLDPTVRPADINNGPNQVGINDYDSLFATALGVVGEVSTNYVFNNKLAVQPEGSGNFRAYRYFQTEAYFGDTWKVNSKLTLAYGVRYQLYSVPYEAHGDESIPTPIPISTFITDRLAQSKAGNSSNTGLPIYSYALAGKANNGPNMYQPNYKDFAPRFAITLAPFSDRKTVFDASAGIIYDRTVINAINFLEDQVPNLFANTAVNNIGDPAGAAASLAVEPRVGTNLAYPASTIPSPQFTNPPYIDPSGNPYGLEEGETNFVIDPNLKDPYAIALTAGVQQELPGHMILKLNYVGRLGRRLTADADANQVLDVPDYTGGSTQSMAGAFAGLTAQLRAGKDYTNVTPEPWFEDVLAPIFGPGQNTSVVAYYAGQLAYRGDIADSIYLLNAYFGNSFFPTNIGMPSQFGSNTYFTNMGSSNYHGMLLTLDKNLSQGLRFEFNYTWSHSIDNTSVSANNNALFTNSNMICDIVHPRACRGSSDFDVRQEINANFLYDLPFGRGKMYMSNAPRWADEAFGGWSISGLPYYRTGLALSATADAYLASFDNLDYAIFTGTSKSDLKAAINTVHASNGSTVYTFKGGAAGAAKVLSEFRGPLGIEYGQRNLMTGPGAFFLDAGLGKKFPLVEDKLNLNFRADAYNVLNHPVFGTGALDIVNDASEFGQVTGTETGPDGQSSRVAQFSLRLEF
jgi:hypothetical protein